MSTREIAEPKLRVGASARTGEWAFVLGTLAMVLAITALPYLYSHLSAPADRQFMGIMLNVPDHAQYFSWMRELSEAPLAANKLTSEPNAPVFFNLLWWALGRLAVTTGLSYAGAFQVLRVVATAAFFVLLYRLCAYLLRDRWARRTAFLLTAVSSGFGWVLVLLKHTVLDGRLLYPLDVYIAEGNTFLSILAYPHFVAAATYIAVFELVLRGQESGQLRYSVAAGVVALFLGWQHAYDLILMYGVIGGYTLLVALRDRRVPRYLVRGLVVIVAMSVWPGLYSFVLTSLDSLWGQVLSQFTNAGVYTPNPLHLVVLLGPAFLLALYTLVRDKPLRLQGLDNRRLFVRAWLLGNLVLIYLPVNFQVHLLNGIQVPIAIIATEGLRTHIVPLLGRVTAQRWPTLRASVPVLAATALLLVVMPTNAYLWAWRFVDLGRHNYPYYLHRDELAAMAWLESNALPEDVVLSSETVGQYVPAYTGAHAFLAHWAQTVNYYERREQVRSFFDEETPDARRRQILHAHGVDYLIHGPAERALGAYDPQELPSLLPVYESGVVRVYRVAGNEP